MTETGGVAKSYTYDNLGSRTSFTLQVSGATKLNTTYTYDVMNRLHQVSEDGNLTATYAYDTNGNRASLTYANGTAESPCDWEMQVENRETTEVALMKNKNVILLLIFCMISMILFAGCGSASGDDKQVVPDDGINDDVILCGTTNGNMNNEGLAAFSEGWIYLRDENSQNGLSKIKSDSKIELSDESVNSINVVEEWVYYSDLGDGRSIYKIKTDGSNCEKIVDGNSENIFVYDERIYYLEVLTDIRNLCSVSLDGTDKIIVAQEIEEYNIYKNFIYYRAAAEEGEGEWIYRVKLDGTQKTPIIEEGSEKFIIENDAILSFYSSSQNESILCSYNINDLSEKKELFRSDGWQIINADKDWIYVYSELSLIRMDYNGVGRKELLSNIQLTGCIIVLDDWIYFATDSYVLVYGVKKDGSVTSYVNNGEWPDQFPLIVTASSFLTEGHKEYSPEYTIDNNSETAWVEGSEGDGVGEWIQFNNTALVDGQSQAMVESVRGKYICNGFCSSEELYYANNRIKKLKIEFSNGESIITELVDGILETQEIDFGKNINTESIKITILEVYKGSRYNDTCISELFFYPGGYEGGI